MRIIIKGGVWRNTEDEILKAAISKYGKNQWARISSLLVRKTPKQCKARWYEWLDPSIKKTEWSKEEDEKLLHLAKLMPTQWRTIAPIVGRTANQCLERYQRLLDEAEQREAAEGDDDLGLTGTGAEAGPSADDVRRLRPGEVDPDPEAKPARPDPIDMDEDEKEMLSEARARLANTQGKKAKRKARERQLEEARRLAMLQKKRELKAAGIVMRMRPKKDGMDYNADIPFEKQPAPGFYDTTQEKNKFTAAPVGKNLRQLDSHKRTRAEDEEERRKRARKAKEMAADKDASAHFVPAKDNLIQRQKEEANILKRRALVLPEPQVGDSELEDIVKIGQAGETAKSLVEDGGEGASQGLLGEYSTLQHAQTARTPRTPAQADNIMAEARNLRNMTMAQTPLLGEANTPLHELVGRGTGFDGATPSRVVTATPNPLATPLHKNGRDPSATPGGDSVSVDGTPMRTPTTRNTLNINAGDDRSIVGDTPRARNMDVKQQLRQGFMALPKPKNDYELVLPEEEQERIAELVDEAGSMIEDAADRKAKMQAVQAAEEQKALARRSQAIQRGLPRPVELNEERLRRSLDQGSSKPEDDLERQIMDEMIQLLSHDAVVYPIAGGKIPGGGRSDLAPIEDEAIAKAKEMVHLEMANSCGFPGANADQIRRVAVLAEEELFKRTWEDCSKKYAFDVRTLSWVESSTLDENQKIGGLKYMIDEGRTNMIKDANACNKAEKKLTKLVGGYQARSKGLSEKLRSRVAELDRYQIELASFERLEINEQGAARRRLEKLEEEVQTLTRRGREGQDTYKELVDAKALLLAEVEDMKAEITMREVEAANEAALA
ncbi:Pre-mRNA-splicing factor cef1 [Puccinia graminis f. sp. tritici]|uniref:Pre-mRNA-splicing factor CEF1 n=1 Tax=Puccinia graminis f. sp. tritici TaxID=56615 RepID=A0A5B0PVQ5_PUCGR|nr:Pre-mRNA-splicing factor cef1 [Puccinia graminis f. sp. tritici]KAA1105126.1 Pre-mRNA-splicing factor cef1 [Puccinia graminis f. sp. tritici]